MGYSPDYPCILSYLPLTGIVPHAKHKQKPSCRFEPTGGCPSGLPGAGSPPPTRAHETRPRVDLDFGRRLALRFIERRHGRLGRAELGQVFARGDQARDPRTARRRTTLGAENKDPPAGLACGRVPIYPSTNLPVTSSSRRQPPVASHSCQQPVERQGVGRPAINAGCRGGGAQRIHDRFLGCVGDGFK